MTASAMLTALAVGAAGGAGSVLRHGLHHRWPAVDVGSPWRRQPWGLWAANLLGSLLIGVAAALPPGAGSAVLGAGAAGGLTTWSTWAVTAHRRWQAAGSRADAGGEVRRADAGGCSRERSVLRRAVLLQTVGQASAGALCVMLGGALGHAVV